MRILIAKDEAFNFIYRANIDSLLTMGEVRFSHLFTTVICLRAIFSICQEATPNYISTTSREILK